MVASAVPTIVSTIVSQDMAGIGVKARFADINFTNASPRSLNYYDRWYDFDGGIPATIIIGGHRYLQCEDARTNLITENHDLDDDDWSCLRSTPSPDVSAAPDGTATADKLIEDGTAANTHHCNQNITPDGASNYVVSCYIKSSGRNWIGLRITTQGFVDNVWAFFNASTGAVGTTSGSPLAYGIEQAPNGFYKIYASQTSDAAAASGIAFYLCDADNSYIYDGDTASGMLIWGAQVTKGIYPRSPIHTEASTVQRAKDQAYWASANVPLGLRKDITFRWIPYAPHSIVGSRSLIEFDESGASNNIHCYFKGADDKIYVSDETAPADLVVSDAVTFSRLQTTQIKLIPSEGKMILSGFTTGNGTYTGTPWSTSAGNVWIGMNESAAQQCGGLISEPW